MIFNSLSNLKEKIKEKRSEKVLVESKDLKELIYHFERLDEEIRIENKRDNISILETKLSSIIDQIDISSDIAKSDDKYYRLLIQRETAKFRELVSSDGHKFYLATKSNTPVKS